MEVDISAIPPGEVVQTVWNGSPIFIRRLTNEEYEEDMAVPKHLLLEPEGSFNVL